ncbi:MAG TPA: hypothetical protein VJP76_09400 [Candidatus Tumulicola sp.]|nr:hypothetical protein [Candidatus Tumulicola sp.]
MNWCRTGLCGLAAAIALAGCAGALQPPAESAPQAAPLKSWMLPGAQKQSNLLYVSNVGARDVTVYTYANGYGLLLVGTLAGFAQPTGMCADSAGDVFISDVLTEFNKSGQVFEYAHGGTNPIYNLTLRLGFPYACAVDPKTGNLAVVVKHTGGNYGAYGAVNVYPEGGHSKSRKIYAAATGFSAVYSVTYDDKGNLYADASPCFDSVCYYGGGPPGLYVLTPGSQYFTPLTLSGGTLYQPAAISWVNPIFLVGDENLQNQRSPGAYKVYVSGSSATVVGTIQYAGTQQFFGSWRRASRVIVPDYTGNVVRVYNLSDGSFVSELSSEISSPYAAVVSQGAK